MAGLRGQVREPVADARARRNSSNLAGTLQFIDPAGVIQIDGEGYIQLTLDADGGLADTAGELSIDLDTDPGLALSATGLTVLAAAPLSLSASGIGLDLLAAGGLEVSSSALAIKLPASSGLQLAAGGLSIDLDTDPGLQLAAGGLSVIAASPAAIGGVNQAAARADSGQTTVTLTLVTDPAAAPVDAAALRDDLVANALPNLRTRDGELETAVETLAGEFNDLLAKLRTAGILNT